MPMMGRAPWQILIAGIGYLPICVKTQGVLPWRRASQNSVIWFSFEILFLWWSFIPTLCWQLFRIVFLGMIPVSWCCRPISVLDRGFCLSATWSPLHSLLRYSLSRALGRPYPLGIFCKCLMYVRTHKYQNSNVVRITRAVRGIMSVRNTARRVAVPRTH